MSTELSGKWVYRARARAPWRYRFRIDGHPYSDECQRPNGTAIHDKKEAEAFAKAKYEEIANGLKQAVAAGQEPWRFERACAFWLARNDIELVGLTLRSPGLTVGKKWALEMLEKYNYVATGYLREKGLAEQVRWLCSGKVVGPGVYLQEFGKADIKRARDARVLTKKPNGKRVAAKTVNKTLNLLRRIVHFASAEGDAILLNIKWSGLFMKIDKVDAPKDIAPSVQARIYATVRPDYVPIIEFARTSGLRSSENILRWPQVLPFEDGEARGVEVKSRGEVRKKRDVPLGPIEVAILREEYARPDRHPEFVFTFVAKRTNFNKRAGRKYVKGKRYPITEEGFKSEWQRMQERAGGTLDGYNRHRLRHAAGWDIGRKNNDPRAVMKNLGHSNLATSQLYTGIDEQAARDAKSGAPRASALVAAENRKLVGAAKSVATGQKRARKKTTVVPKVVPRKSNARKTLQNKG